jgi:hypothetical protein
LPSDSSPTPFSVPNGYFEGLASSILAKVKSQSSDEEITSLSPLLAGISKKMLYSVPENYFQGNMESLPAYFHEIESPVLSSIGKEMPYQVPADYFSELPEQVASRIFAPKAKVVPLFKRSWMKMAAAAILGGIITISGYNYFNADASNKNIANNNPDPVNQQQAIAEKDSKKQTAIIKELKTISTQELDAFIQKVDVKTSVARKTTNKKDLREELKDVSNTELDSFLDQIPTADDELLID